MACFGRAAVLALCLLSWRSRCAALVVPESEALPVVLTKLAAAPGLSARCQQALRGLSSNVTQPATMVETMIAITQARVATGRVMEALPMMNMAYNLGLTRKGTRKTALASFPVVSVGNPDACAFIRDFHYCRIDLGWVLIRFGVCLPTTCGASDVATILNNTYHNYDFSGGMMGVSNANRWLSPKMPLRETTFCGAEAYGFSATTGTHIMVAITVALIFIAVIATAVDMLRTHLKAHLEDQDATPDAGATARLTRWATRASTPVDALLCWSLVRNFRGLIAKQRGGPTDCLDGIRALAGLWIIYSHTISYGALNLTYTNNYKAMRLGTTVAGQSMFQGFFAVDTFLFIGAFLAIHLMIRMLERVRVSKGPRAIAYMSIKAPRLYVLRYIRVTPAYAYALFMYWHVLRVADRGPFFTSVLAPEYASCRASWFANLLFINNFWDQVIKKRPGTCFGATWYLALDFQLFLLTPFVAALAWWRHNVALSLLALATLFSVVYTYVESNRRRWTLDWMESLDYYHTGYVLPWFRAPPYLIGMALAIVWHRYLGRSTQKTLPHAARNGKPLQGSGRKEAVNGLIMAAAIAMFGVLVLGGKDSIGSTPSYWSQSRMDAYITLSKPAWALALCCMCVVMFRGGGGWIRALLECRPLLVVSRLTYCMYLIHIPVLQWLYGMLGPLHYSTIWFLTTYYGVVVVSILFSTFTYLLVESPVSLLVKLLTTGRSKSTVRHKDEEELASAASSTAAVESTSLTSDAPSAPLDVSGMSDSRSYLGGGSGGANQQ